MDKTMLDKTMLDETIIAAIGALHFGEAVSYGGLTALPLLSDEPQGPRYLTLGEALDAGVVTVTEVSEAGSVADLRVISRADQHILIVDGEELSGAKQNRCLNTSVLIAPRSETRVPVSCTEHGRWGYASENHAFSESGQVMAWAARAGRTARVHESLASGASFTSWEGQSQVWDSIQSLSQRAASPSPTSAMRDVFESRAGSLDAAIAAIPAKPCQVGSLFLSGSDVLGLDVVSRPAAYARLHPKFVRSYLLGTLLSAPTVRADGETEMAQAFLDRMMSADAKVFASVGCGQDHRLSAPRQIGSALVWEGTVLHLAYFEAEEAPARSRNHHAGMANLHQRREGRWGL